MVSFTAIAFEEENSQLISQYKTEYQDIQERQLAAGRNFGQIKKKVGTKKFRELLEKEGL
jgi:hypothetical protein